MGVRTDSAVAKLAAGQKTLVTTVQLAACGLNKDAVAYRVHSRRLRPVFRGVYTASPGELPPLALEQAALLACGKQCFISHHSAAFIWGLRKMPPKQVEVSVVGRYCDSRRGIRVHRIQSIDESERQRHEGLWISSPARTVLEVAATASRDEVADVVNEGHGLRLFTRRDLEAVLRRNR